jgi:hypothetical protein
MIPIGVGLDTTERYPLGFSRPAWLLRSRVSPMARPGPRKPYEIAIRAFFNNLP